MAGSVSGTSSSSMGNPLRVSHVAPDKVSASPLDEQDKTEPETEEPRWEYMLGAGDADRVLGFLRERRSAYYDSTHKERREHLAMEIYGFMATSPSANLELRGDDMELTSAAFAERFELASAMRPIEDESKENEAAAATLKINFEEMKKQQNDSFRFSRVPLPQPDQRVDASAQTDNKHLSLLRAIFPPPDPPKLVSLKLFIKRPDKRGTEELQVSVPQTACSSRVVEMAKKAYLEAKKEPLPDTGTWMLRMAEEDGAIDADFPPLREDQTVHKMGRYFAMIGSSGDSSRKETTRGTTKLVKVILPNAQYQTIPFDPAMKVSVLLRKVCDKWSFSTTEYAFTKEDVPDEIPGDITLRDLDVQTSGRNNIVLKKREIKLEDTSKVFEKPYSVVKLKKFGLRQERVITIAPDIITNHSAKSGSNTKKPVRLIRDVKLAKLIDKKPQMFHLEFEGEEKTYTYKAKSEIEAKEIVTRIHMYKNKLATSAG